MICFETFLQRVFRLQYKALFYIAQQHLCWIVMGKSGEKPESCYEWQLLERSATTR